MYFGMLRFHNKNIIHSVYCCKLGGGGGGGHKVLKSRKPNSELEVTHINVLKSIHGETISKEQVRGITAASFHL
jgi:hypothetical protein